MARRNISVPDDLSNRMDRLTDRVNWSAVAQAAFESELGRYPNWTEDRMTAVIERLRASKAETMKGSEDRGFADGKEWAEKHAGYAELKALAESELDDDCDPEEIDSDEIPRQAEGEESDAAVFWEAAVGPDWKRNVNGHFQIGFYRGAKAVWDEVEDQI